MQKEIVVNVCLHSVKVVLNGRSGGCFSFPRDNEVAQINIGVGESVWFEVVDTAFHELLEFVMVAMGHRYVVSGVYSRASEATSFFFSHDELVVMGAEVSRAWCKIEPAVREAWIKYKKTVKKKK